VPEGLRHLPPAAVDEEAVRDHRVVRGAALDGDAGQERAVEPAAVLVAALQVEVRPAAELGAPLDDRLPADTGIEPDVEDVRLETEARPRAAGAGESGRYQLGGRTPEPGVGPLALEDVRDVRAQGLAGDRLAARLAVDRDHRHAPVALARDAPVRSRRDHVRDPLAAPAGYPAHARDLGERAAAELGPLHA